MCNSKNEKTAYFWVGPIIMLMPQLMLMTAPVSGMVMVTSWSLTSLPTTCLRGRSSPVLSLRGESPHHPGLVSPAFGHRGEADL